MAKDWTDEEIQEEIRRNVQIVREDRERAQYAALHATYGKTPDNQDPADPKKAPPKKDEPAPDGPPAPPKSRRSLWWGEALGDDAP